MPNTFTSCLLLERSGVRCRIQLNDGLEVGRSTLDAPRHLASERDSPFGRHAAPYLKYVKAHIARQRQDTPAHDQKSQTPDALGWVAYAQSLVQD